MKTVTEAWCLRTMRARTILTILIATLSVTACSSGGGGSGDEPTIAAEDDPGTTPFTPEPATPTPTDPPVTEPEPPIDSTPPPAEPTPPPVEPTPPPAEPAPVSVGGPLDDLLGRMTIGWAFTGVDAFFSITADFDVSSLSDTGVLLDSSASTAFREGNQPIEAGRQFLLACTHVDVTDEFLCTATGGLDGTRTVFRLGRVVDGESDGTFAFCGAEVSDNGCIDNLLNFPDGLAVAIVSPIATKQVAPPYTGIDITPYFEYAEQGAVRQEAHKVDALTRGAFRGALESLDR